MDGLARNMLTMNLTNAERSLDNALAAIRSRASRVNDTTGPGEWMTFAAEVAEAGYWAAAVKASRDAVTLAGA